MKWPIIILCLCYIAYCDAQQCPNDDKVIVCYYASWSYYRKNEGHFNINLINTSLCTHIVYTFAGLDINSKITPLDYQYDITKGGYTNFTSLKNENPCVKMLLAIGGWNEGSRKYSVMASTEESRIAFTESVLRFLVAYNFDGFDFDWEYPTKRGGIDDDRENFSLLLKMLHQRLKQWDLILSIAVPISADVSSAYDISTMHQYVDYISIMAYDYTPTDSKTTGLIAPLSKIKENVDFWINGGFPVNKLVLGLPSYARTFTLLNAEDHDLGALTNGSGLSGRYTQEAGFFSYYELKLKLNSEMYTEIFLDEDQNCYAYYNLDWFSYDTIDTYKEKTKYALQKNMKGVMLWTIDTDDFSGKFGEKYTILNAINSVIRPNI